MMKSRCKWCNKEITRRGQRPGVFCNLQCKAAWQRTQKPVGRDWLYQKYVVEGLGTYRIANLVDRNPKQVWHWLKGYNIPTRSLWDGQKMPRERGLSQRKRLRAKLDPRESSLLYTDRDWLSQQYIQQKQSAADMAREAGCSGNTILNWLERFQIPRRSISETRTVKHWGASGEDNPMYGLCGADNPNWRGGSTPERQAFYASIEWCKVAQKVWRRDKGMCQRCHARQAGNRAMHIHHIAPFRVKKLRCKLDNLILLCQECHHWVHSKSNVEGMFVK